MCGLSASFLFAIVTRLFEREAQLARGRAKHPEDLKSPSQDST
jgi:hypothetical protein